MRYKLIPASLLLSAMIPVAAEADVSIGINLSLYPDLVRVPGYPVYYAPEMDSNYFFYDGRYWVYTDDSWYASNWYNGPWEMIEPELVPLYVLRVPVRYYRRPPAYFRDWSAYSPPHWDEHWGNDWSQHHRNWNRWDRHATPAAAPLPVYQKQYSGDRYPQTDEQQRLQKARYHYQPHRVTAPQARQPVRAQRNTGAHVDKTIDQRNGRTTNAQQPGMQTPRASSAHPSQPPAATQNSPPAVHPPVQPRRQQSEQHTNEQRESSPQRAPEPASRHNRNPQHSEQPRNQQRQREKDHD
ncbi:MAG: hypothetical protein ABUS47_04840 [Steroidobacter sp.]